MIEVVILVGSYCLLLFIQIYEKKVWTKVASRGKKTKK